MTTELIPLSVHTKDTSFPDTLEGRQFSLALGGCDASLDDQTCGKRPEYIILFDLKGFVTNRDGSIELYDVQGVPVMACSEEHAKAVLATLIPDPENLSCNHRTITVEEWLSELSLVE